MAMDDLAGILKKHWGYDSFLPLQREAMDCVLSGTDSLVVLPTGGGKSLCYQAPAVALPGTAIVVSPLISLMKDQVDALTESGVSAARIDSSLDAADKRDTFQRLRDGALRLLYVAPERLMMDSFRSVLSGVRISFIAVDEAHCVSMWGHDFRPEYRQLGELKGAFAGVAIHAYTATATPQVRDDIVEQLGLAKPAVHIGEFDRPNLFYRAERRTDRLAQVTEVLERHKGESGIIYVIRRKDVDELAVTLRARGYHALPYHAGMTDADRKRNQEAFIQGDDAIVVATVAFGMGIDKPNVRFVIHAAMPKSIEHYQQESGRAGRDSLPADCVLLYSGQDFRVWQSIIAEMPDEPRRVAERKLSDVWEYCTRRSCRHQALVRYFGQEIRTPTCSACDACTVQEDLLEDALVTAQKIVSCVVRLRERFGAEYTTAVLAGSREQRIKDNRHDELSTYGVLGEHPQRVVRDWTEQLVDQDYLRKVGEYATLQVTGAGRRVLAGSETPRLFKPRANAPVVAKAKSSRAKSRTLAETPGDQGLVAKLRAMRTRVAKSRHIPAYVVFGDVTLLELASARPSSADDLVLVHGMGDARVAKYGDEILRTIREHARGEPDASSQADRDVALPEGD